MKSYNCFYSALFDVLSLSLDKKAHLLINNRWQFFYNKLFQYYSDDHRILGEYPLLYDESHLHVLDVELGIKIKFLNLSCGLKELKKYIAKDGYVVIFANLYMLMDTISSKSKTCVTTILLNEINDLYVKFISYDKQIGSKVINLKKVDQAWKNASEFPFLNQCVVLISYEKVPTDDVILRFFFKCIQNSVDIYMRPIQNNSFLQGTSALREYAKDIGKLFFANREILIDCAMYMELAIRQRECLLEAMRIMDFSMDCTALEEGIEQIINKWRSVKMYIYIVGERKQYTSLKFVQKQLYKLAEEETLLLKKVRSIKIENFKSIQME